VPNTDLSSLTPSTTFTPQALQRMSFGMQRKVQREIEQVQARAIIAKLHEDGRAVLADTALNNLGALSALEGHLIEVAPLGEARYRAIVDAYALGAAQAIQRW
jgi:hypothetical protein